VLPATAKRLLDKLRCLEEKGMITKESRIVFVDDGSKDTTWKLIENYCKNDPGHFCGIKLSKNRGHQNALLCGLLTVKGHFDAVISIDADLQDDIEVFDEMIDKFKTGCEIVYGVRSERKTDSFFKRITAHWFYSFMHFLGVDIVYNHADFRLMGRRALDALAEYDEVNLFIRGIVPILGFVTDRVYYKRSKRLAGESKYPLIKMLSFSFQGITSFSIKPIRLITLLGFLIFCCSIGLIIYFIAQHFKGITIQGWSSMIVSLWFIGGLILLAIGITGEYIGKIYLEAKRRPRYIIEELLGLS
jgi:glycosyltransferase involved in cell wall biosynthesis